MAMTNIKEKLDKIKERISAPNFLANKGLANEVGIHVFSYAPQDELIVREYIERVVATPPENCRIIELDMYKILLKILEEKRMLDKIPSWEEEKGKNKVFHRIQKVADRDDFLTKMRYKPHKRGDVLFLTGVGKVYPFMRTHIMLNSMQKSFEDIPIVIFYPGEHNDGQCLSLFGKFHDANYYRMFNLL